MKKLFTITFLFFVVFAGAQVKIGNNPNTINANSLLELESNNKGFLPPRVALISNTSVCPLTDAVPAGMLVYSSGGTLTDGYYYWNGAEWASLGAGQFNVVTKTANASLSKSETFVLASNDITITLPTVTSTDNGLAITVKNMGSHTDLITVQGNGGASVDRGSDSKLTRYLGQTFVATGGNWVIKEAKKHEDFLLNVDENSSWTTIREVMDYLELHMTRPVVVRLTDDAYDISGTITVDLPYAVTFQGTSYGTSTISAASGLAGKPMFRCLSECSFKMLTFDATTLTNYGAASGEDAIRFLGSGTHNEVKNCSFDRFYNTILDSTNAEIRVFETDISNAQRNGILVHGSVAGVTLKVAETDFIGCARGINLSKATAAIIQLSSSGYYNSNSTDTAIVYNPSAFISFTCMSIKGNLWNNTGKYIEGFDFSRLDGRDANVIMESNAGVGDKKPHCFINVLNSTSTTYLADLNTWYKVNWGTSTSAETSKWAMNNNKISYLPVNSSNGWMLISGNVSVDANSQNLKVGIVKNGVTGTQYGATTIGTTTADHLFTFSIIVNLTDIGPNDYFELFVKNETAGLKTVKFQDIQWLVNTQ